MTIKSNHNKLTYRYNRHDYPIKLVDENNNDDKTHNWASLILASLRIDSMRFLAFKASHQEWGA